MKPTKLSFQIRDRAQTLYFYGYSLHEIASRLKVSVTTLSKYKQTDNWTDDKIPAFTFDDLLEDTEIVYFLACQQVLRAYRNGDTENLNIQQTALLLKNLSATLKEMTALAPLRSSKIALENIETLMERAAKKAPSDAENILQFLQEEYERARSIVAGIPAQD